MPYVILHKLQSALCTPPLSLFLMPSPHPSLSLLSAAANRQKVQIKRAGRGAASESLVQNFNN